MRILIARIVCWFKKRHTEENMKKNGEKFHQFYDMNGGGRRCICRECGYSVIIRGK